VDRDVRYVLGASREHWLDLYWPKRSGPPAAWMLYVHGGGFRMLSKDSDWIPSLAFARRGLCVANVNYRLAPAHPFPAALEDCARALCWLAARAPALGLPLDGLVLAGESAGANLAAALALLCCYRRPEPWAREVWQLGLRPRALMLYYGLLQASQPERLRKQDRAVSAALPADASRWARLAARLRCPRPARAVVQSHIEQISAGYLPVRSDLEPTTLELADPLVFLERGLRPERPLPACFAAVGTRDPLLPDTRRLSGAYERLGAACDARYYADQIHGFNVLIWTEAAKQCWKDSYAFLGRHLRLPAATSR
jgi:acetyl esterase